MTAVETIERLVKLGTVIRSAVSDAQAGSASFDWEKFLSSDAYKDISKTVESLAKSLSDNDIEHTIDRLAKKQAALLGNTKLEDLPVEKLIQYAQLSDAKMILRAKKVALAANPPFLAWLADDALPVLIKVAPAIIPLLL